MKLQEIEERVGELGALEGMDFLYGLLGAYGLPKASITRLRSGTYDKAEAEEEKLWRSKVWFRDARGLEDDALYPLIDSAASDIRVKGLNPRFLIVRNGSRLLAKDTTTAATLDITHEELVANAGFFLPWAGIEKTRLENVNVADVKAAEKMAKLYDEIIRHNEIEDQEAIHDLNVFFSRLLFCFFAEDTGVFEEGSFTNAIGSLTQESGSDTAEFLDRLFVLLDVEPTNRGEVPSELSGFGYVNGKLFERRSAVPHFSARARSVVLECGTLDWSQINPDIFGSMIQAVVHPSQRAGLGMHYTSVENIMKVIRPLFLDDLEQELESAEAVDVSGLDRAGDVLGPSDMELDAANRKAVRRLERFIERLSRIQVFDPACGSGNFLVIAYKELRRLEHMALQRIAELDPGKAGLFKLSSIELDSFYGIEIDDFAHEVAILSLWLAKHQMNIEFKELFGAEIPLIPLVEAGQIIHGNASRLDWEDVCDATNSETYVLGNPPYLGGTRQSEENKADLVTAFDDRNVNRYLDYVSIWLIKGANFVASSDAAVGLVTTNSVSQGNHVALLWPRVKAAGAEISFAHAPFLWKNSARGQAGVTCVVIGLTKRGSRQAKRFYEDGGVKTVRTINSYLVPEGPDVIVAQTKERPAGLPGMVFGSMPRDGGHLLLTHMERDRLLEESPEAEPFVRKYMGSEEFLKGKTRFCLWIPDSAASVAAAIPSISARLEKVADYRRLSKASSTRAYAGRPHLFVQRAHQDGPAVVVPGVSSERRHYVPMGFVDGDTVVSNAAFASYGAEPWLFGLIQSRMHMAWMRAVGGQLESRIRYSAVLVYNTFPVPQFASGQRGVLTEKAIGVLGAREQFPDRTLNDLYDPDKMPDTLQDAHGELDEVVDRLYDRRGFSTDEDRLARLFEMYKPAIASGGDDA